MTKLLPCPFCGEYPKIAEDGGSTGPWFCVWHDCPPVEGGKARHYGESLGAISISTTWFHTEAGAIAAWNTRAERTRKVEVRESAWGGYTRHCGGCGADLDCDTRNRPNYCPNCGARVIKSDQYL